MPNPSSPDAKVAVMAAISRSNATDSLNKQLVTNSVAFNSLYQEKRKHPGSPFFFSCNCEEEFVNSRFDVSNTHKVRIVRPALNKSGKEMPGWVGVFVSL